MAQSLNILVIEDSHADFLMVERHLKQNGLSVHCSRVDSLEGLKELLGRDRFDLVLTDYNVPQLNFLESLNVMLSALPDLPVIMVSGTVGEEKAVELLKLGVRDFVLKENLARLVPALLRSLKDNQEREERRCAEESLRQSEAKLRSIMDNIGIGVVLISPGMEILELNRRMREWFPAIDPDRRCICYRVFNNPPRDAVCVNCPTQKTLQDGLVHEETMQTPQSGGTRNYRIVSSPIFNTAGKVTAVIEMVEDITDKLSLESQFRQAQKMEAVGQLAGGVAHDFNNILSTISGYGHLILDYVKENDPVKLHAEEILDATKRAAVLTQSLLAFSRKQTVDLAVVDLNTILSGFEAFIRRLIREDIELQLHCSEEPLSIMADRGQIEQVIMNLVTNARDAMPEGGRLFIETLPVTMDNTFIETHGYGTAGAYTLLSVSDSGAGMDKETQLHIFEPFFTTKEQGKGTGLGLSMAYGIVKRHEGFINVYSEPGNGTTFRIYLPRVQAAEQVLNEVAGEEAPLRGGSETILVGEDDAGLRKLTTRVLSHYGYRVLEAVDGLDAVNKFIEFNDSIHLVILDLIMPVKNGKQACDEMKAVRPALKVIFTSGYARDIINDNNPLDEYTDFILKPVSPNELVAKVREMLDK